MEVVVLLTENLLQYCCNECNLVQYAQMKQIATSTSDFATLIKKGGIYLHMSTAQKCSMS